MKKLAALVLAATMATSAVSTANAQPVPASLAAGTGLTTGIIVGGILFVVTVASIVKNDGPSATGTN